MMTDTTPTPPPPPVAGNAAPFYTSKVFVLALVDAVASVALVFNVHVNTDALTNALNAILALVAVGAPIWGAVARWRSTLQPLTTTQGKADAQNSTVVSSTPPAPKP
jgi:hypothetical protein